MSNKNQCMFSVSRNGNNIIIWGCNNPKRLQVMASDPTDSEWFTRFITGLSSGIGPLKIKIQLLFEFKCQLTVKKNNKGHIRTAAENGSFHIFTYCRSLRRYETPKFRSMIFIARFYLSKNQRFLRNEGIILFPTYIYPFWNALSLELRRSNVILLIYAGRQSMVFNR